MAVDARTRAMDEEAEIDEFWCVFDVEWPENHPGLMDAVEQARQNGVQLAVPSSGECAGATCPRVFSGGETGEDVPPFAAFPNVA